jgi:hypothetical protein
MQKFACVYVCVCDVCAYIISWLWRGNAVKEHVTEPCMYAEICMCICICVCDVCACIISWFWRENAVEEHVTDPCMYVELLHLYMYVCV